MAGIVYLPRRTPQQEECDGGMAELCAGRIVPWGPDDRPENMVHANYLIEDWQ
jgi:hypothetical protein